MLNSFVDDLKKNSTAIILYFNNQFRYYYISNIEEESTKILNEISHDYI